MQRLTGFQQHGPSWTKECQLTKEQIVATISSLLARHRIKIVIFSLSNNLLYSWRDAYYSTNTPHIDHVVQVFTHLHREIYLFDHLIDILTSEFHTLCIYNYAILWLNTDLTRRGVRLAWRCSIVNWLIGIQRKNNLKVEVTQHAVRLIDAVDTLQGRNERLYQLRAMGFFILAAKFHNRSRIRMEEFSRYSANAFEPREIADCMRTVYNEINFELQIPLASDFLEFYLELNINGSCLSNRTKIRALATLFIHVACIQSWSSCFNASLLAGAVLVLCLKFLQHASHDVPHLCSIVWSFDHPVELVLGLAGYIALIVGDMPDVATDRANHYFYAHKMYYDEFRHQTIGDFTIDRVKTFCRLFVQMVEVNRQISRGMRTLVFSQLRVLERAHPQGFNPSLSINSASSTRTMNTIGKCQPMQLTIRAVLAAKRFAKGVLQRRRLIQQLATTTLID